MEKHSNSTWKEVRIKQETIQMNLLQNIMNMIKAISQYWLDFSLRKPPWAHVEVHSWLFLTHFLLLVLSHPSLVQQLFPLCGQTKNSDARGL